MSELREEARELAGKFWTAMHEKRPRTRDQITTAVESFARRAVCAELRRLADEIDGWCRTASYGATTQRAARNGR